MSDAPTVRVVLGDPAPRTAEAVRYLLEAVGARAIPVTAEEPPVGACLHHAHEPNGAHAECVAIAHRPADRLWRELLDGRLPTDEVGRRIGFDIVSASAALMDDLDSRAVGAAARDRHARMPLARTLHGGAGFGATAIVNRYAAVLAAALVAAGLRDPLPRWPDGRRAAIGLSHDVDRPDKYAVVRAVPRGGPRLWLRRPELVLRAGRDLVRWMRDADREDFWLFEEVIDSEARHGFRSTFLFAAMPSHGPYGSRHDVHYDIGWARFGSLFAELRRREVEVGLHASYEAYRRPERFVLERRRLEGRAGVPVRGLRHHYWHVGPDPAPTLRAHEAAGFAYDSSLAFNDAPGLRRGIALPYRPWDASLGRRLQVLQLPVLAMDSAMFGGQAHAEADPEAAADRLWTAIGEVRATGGLGVLDWHVRASFPANRAYRGWAECYQRTLARLAATPDVWVTDLGSIERWWTAREQRLQTTPGSGREES